MSRVRQVIHYSDDGGVKESTQYFNPQKAINHTGVDKRWAPLLAPSFGPNEKNEKFIFDKNYFYKNCDTQIRQNEEPFKNHHEART